MPIAKIVLILQKLLPTKKLVAYVVAGVVAVAAALLSIDQSELKDAYCKSDISISLPKEQK